MYSTMKSLCGKDLFVSVYDDSADTSKFKFGMLLCVNESRYAMLLLSPYGDYDGIVVDDAEDVFRVDTCGRYHEKMEKLNRMRSENIDLPDIDPSCIDLSVLSFIKEQGNIASIELDESGVYDITGFVEDVSATVCKVHRINEYGCDDGYSYINMDSISEIAFGSEDEERIMRLYQANTK